MDEIIKVFNIQAQNLIDHEMQPDSKDETSSIIEKIKNSKTHYFALDFDINFESRTKEQKENELKLIVEDELKNAKLVNIISLMGNGGNNNGIPEIVIKINDSYESACKILIHFIVNFL